MNVLVSNISGIKMGNIIIVSFSIGEENVGKIHFNLRVVKSD